MAKWKPTPPPAEPWCVLAKVAFGMPRTVRVPESRAPMLIEKHGWRYLIRESDFEPDPPAMDIKLMSNPRRVAEPDEQC
mgnify:CR=1 FL=1